MPLLTQNRLFYGEMKGGLIRSSDGGLCGAVPAWLSPLVMTSTQTRINRNITKRKKESQEKKFKF
jgi:hypothetical protein